MAKLMTIGEFASVTWLSPKALRLYDRKGLLSPDTVDPHSGYRKYSPAQVETARLITLLRRIDMPLEQVRDLLGTSSEERAAQVARYREREAEQHARRQALAEFIEHAVGVGSMDAEKQPGVAKFEVATRTVPEAALLTSTRHTSARDLPEIVNTIATRLFGLAAERGGATGRLIVIYHGQVGWESDGPVEVCVPIAEPDRAHRIEPEHRELFTSVPAEEVQFPRILAAFEAVQLRAAQLGLAPAGPPREVYGPQSAGTAPRCEVALPIIAGEPPAALATSAIAQERR
ncbi:MAG TPA: helix-turn-helix domain-containing protein [Actinomycetaceae bacterium]|nr:helix-turn-helix domain-containing protein [Actinomycetaceae bacterium]